MEIKGRVVVYMVLLVSLSIGWRASGTLRRPGGRRVTPPQDPSKVTELRGLAEFAVHQYNSMQGTDLQFVRLISSEQQVVAGMMYYLVLEAMTSQGNNGIYEAKVWVKVWEDFMSLEEFTSLDPESSRSALNSEFRTSDFDAELVEAKC